MPLLVVHTQCGNVYVMDAFVLIVVLTIIFWFQMSSKDAVISSLQTTVSKLQRDYAQLEQNHCRSHKHAESNSLGLDEGLELIRPSTGASSCVPYEAMGTLKMRSFTTLPTGEPLY